MCQNILVNRIINSLDVSNDSGPNQLANKMLRSDANKHFFHMQQDAFWFIYRVTHKFANRFQNGLIKKLPYGFW